MVIRGCCLIVAVVVGATASSSLHIVLQATNALEVTSRGKLDSAKALFLDVLDYCKESVAILTLPELKFSKWNKYSHHIFGDVDENMSMLELVYENDKHVMRESVSQLVELSYKMQSSHDKSEESYGWNDEEQPLLSSSTSPTSLKIQYRHHDSHYALTWLESSLFLPHYLVDVDNISPIVVLLTHDITERKLQRDTLKGENAAKLQYITCCAHDLKTPLQSFRTALDLLLQSGLSKYQEAIWTHAEISVSLMNLTISQTLDTSKALMVQSVHPPTINHTTTYFVIHVSCRAMISLRKKSIAFFLRY